MLFWTKVCLKKAIAEAYFERYTPCCFTSPMLAEMPSFMATKIAAE